MWQGDRHQNDQDHRHDDHGNDGPGATAVAGLGRDGSSSAGLSQTSSAGTVGCSAPVYAPTPIGHWPRATNQECSRTVST